jgi:excisionase family DNA binding protein
VGIASNKALGKPDTVVPSKRDAELATESSRILSSIEDRDEFQVRLDNGQVLILPKAVKTLLTHLLTQMSYGNAVTLIPIHAELTTQEAADHLNVSRPYLISLLEAGEIKFRKVGTHRRIKFSDLRSFEECKEQEREAALTELAQQAQDLKLGY